MTQHHPVDVDLITAIATPFTKEGVIDFAALERLTQHLIDTGSDGILVNGSTGENPTVSQDEKMAILRAVKQTIGSQPVKLIAGSATNDTRSTIDLCRENAKEGVDALLVVTPYYNKPSQQGLLAHYSAIAHGADAPVIIYNIPGRSIINMQPETMATLAERFPNIVGVKQSNPDMDQVSDIRRKTPESFRIWSGDDSMTLPMMTLGAYGTFSVAAHLTGRLIRQMIDAFKARQLETSLELHLKQMDVFKDLFFLPNPTVVKACLAQLGMMEPWMRLPLVPVEDDADQARIKRLVERVQQLQPYPALR